MTARPAGSGSSDDDRPGYLPEPWTARLPESSKRMIEAAIDAFAERGYHATTTRDIATRVGLSPAALYVHFPSKQALLTQISVAGHEAALELVERSLTGVDDPLGQLRSVMRAFSSWYAQYHLVARVVQHELSALADDDRRRVIAMRQTIERQVQALLEAGVRAGQMEVGDTRAVARALLSLSVDVARWYDPKSKETPAGIGELYADLATRMVRPSSPPVADLRGQDPGRDLRGQDLRGQDLRGQDLRGQDLRERDLRGRGEP
jgi:AcrR family transcriptional regulator